MKWSTVWAWSILLLNTPSFGADDPPHYADGAPLPTINLDPIKPRLDHGVVNVPARPASPPTPLPKRRVASRPCSRSSLPTTADCTTGDLGTGLKRPGDKLEPFFSVAVTGGSKPFVHADVFDLPDGTKALVSIEDDYGHLLGQQSVVVKDSEFAAGPFSNGGGNYTEGAYVLDIDLPMANVQPEEVQAWLGRDMSNVTAPQDMGRFIDYTFGQRTFRQRTRIFVNRQR